MFQGVDVDADAAAAIAAIVEFVADSAVVEPMVEVRRHVPLADLPPCAVES